MQQDAGVKEEGGHGVEGGEGPVMQGLGAWTGGQNIDTSTVCVL